MRSTTRPLILVALLLALTALASAEVQGVVYIDGNEGANVWDGNSCTQCPANNPCTLPFWTFFYMKAACDIVLVDKFPSTIVLYCGPETLTVTSLGATLDSYGPWQTNSPDAPFNYRRSGIISRHAKLIVKNMVVSPKIYLTPMEFSAGAGIVFEDISFPNGSIAPTTSKPAPIFSTLYTTTGEASISINNVHFKVDPNARLATSSAQPAPIWVMLDGFGVDTPPSTYTVTNSSCFVNGASCEIVRFVTTPPIYSSSKKWDQLSRDSDNHMSERLSQTENTRSFGLTKRALDPEVETCIAVTFPPVGIDSRVTFNLTLRNSVNLGIGNTDLKALHIEWTDLVLGNYSGKVSNYLGVISASFRNVTRRQTLSNEASLFVSSDNRFSFLSTHIKVEDCDFEEFCWAPLSGGGVISLVNSKLHWPVFDFIGDYGILSRPMNITGQNSSNPFVHTLVNIVTSASRIWGPIATLHPGYYNISGSTFANNITHLSDVSGLDPETNIATFALVGGAYKMTDGTSLPTNMTIQGAKDTTINNLGSFTFSGDLLGGVRSMSAITTGNSGFINFTGAQGDIFLHSISIGAYSINLNPESTGKFVYKVTDAQKGIVLADERVLATVDSISVLWDSDLLGEPEFEVDYVLARPMPPGSVLVSNYDDKYEISSSYDEGTKTLSFRFNYIPCSSYCVAGHFNNTCTVANQCPCKQEWSGPYCQCDSAAYPDGNCPLPPGAPPPVTPSSPSSPASPSHPGSPNSGPAPRSSQVTPTSSAPATSFSLAVLSIPLALIAYLMC